MGLPALAALLGPSPKRTWTGGERVAEGGGPHADGKARLRDGRSGEFFSSDVTVARST